ncbi:C-reactive protein 1.4-like precursor [Limulus polyphemus]|uniref:Pentraxin family member n=2 Tax=Limulus polyphemus TaxID=6850 RepID=Q8WQK3_LIMPO|nr:C-reactive protein 1.4-like precursor [Limulus polyphemus]AAL55404.1 SAP-like pentraxin [Limulus polyphemus]
MVSGYIVIFVILALTKAAVDIRDVKISFPGTQNPKFPHLRFMQTLPAVRQLTVCQRIKPFHRNTGYIFSCATSNQDNQFITSMYVKSDGTLNLGLQVNASSNKYISCPIEIELGQWYHVCHVWSGVDGRMAVYANGSPCGTMENVGKGHQISAGGTVVIGQEQDKIGGGFEEQESWSGELSDLQVWDEALTTHQVSTVASCNGIRPRGNVISWMEDSFVADDGVIVGISHMCSL